MRRYLVAVLVVAALLATGCGALSHTLTASAFTKRVVQRMEVLAPGTNAQVVKALRLRIPGRSSDISLQAAFNAYQAGQNLDLVIDQAVAAITQQRDPIPLSWQEARERIVPLLAGAQAPPAGPGGLVTVPWDAGLQVVLALDGSHGFVNLTAADLARWQVSTEQAYATALQNLSERTFSQPMGRTRIGDRKNPLDLFFWHVQDGLDASRLLLVSDWRDRLLPYINWDMVVIIPDQDQMYAFDGADTDWVSALQDFARKQFASASTPVSDQLYAFHDGHLVPYKP